MVRGLVEGAAATAAGQSESKGSQAGDETDATDDVAPVTDPWLASSPEVLVGAAVFVVGGAPVSEAGELQRRRRVLGFGRTAHRRR